MYQFGQEQAPHLLSVPVKKTCVAGFRGRMKTTNEGMT